MKVVLASLNEINEIKEMYTKIIENMYANNIKIWNEYYPNEVFEEDIINNNLYLLKENDIILGAFAMYEHKDIESSLAWKEKDKKAFFLSRLGVNTEYLHQGLGKELVNIACNIAREKGATYLRLLVSDLNIPAINLYTKCKFDKVDGIQEEVFEDGFTIREYGYEMNLELCDTYN